MMTIQLVVTGSFFLSPFGGVNCFAVGMAAVFFSHLAPLPDFEVSSDASGALGYGALFQRHWFPCSWLATQVSQSIEYKELFPIVVAAYVWGPLWTSKRVNFLSDNSSVVKNLRSGTSRAPDIMVFVTIVS